MNYSQLVTDIQNWTEYSEADFVASIPRFVQMAEERIQRLVYLPYFRKTGSVSTTLGQKLVTLPTDFIFPYAISIVVSGSETNLVQKEPDWIVEAYPTGTQGIPKYYAIASQTQIELGPTPNGAYTINIDYNPKAVSVVTSGDNWISDKAENALLYGSLVNAAIFMRAEQDVKDEYERLFQEALLSLRTVGEVRSRKDDFRLRDRRPVD